MKKQYRLKRNEEIKEIVSSRQYLKSANFNLYYKANLDNQNIRICISTSKKLGNAVIRNRIRRQVREMVRNNFDLSLKYDLVIVVKKNYLDLAFNENLEKIKELYSTFLSKIKGD